MDRIIPKSQVFPYQGFPLRVLRQSPQTDTSRHFHEFTEIVLVTGGRGRHVADAERPVAVGDGFIIPEGLSHSYRETAGLELWNLVFSREALPLPLLDLSMTPGYHALFGAKARRRVVEFHVGREVVAELVPLIEGIAREQQEHRIGYQFASIAAFMRILLLLARSIDVAPEPGEVPVRVGNLIRLLNRHPERKLSLDEMAATASMSVSSLLRHFRAATGHSPTDYLLRVRIAQAAELLLADPGLPIGEAAERAGFADQNYFARQFRRVNGLSPSAFRRKIQKPEGRRQKPES